MDEQITTTTVSRTTTGPADSKLELERQYTVFAVLFAIGSLLVAWQRWEVAMTTHVAMSIHIGMVLAAICVLFRPVLTLPIVFLSLLHVVHGLLGLPKLMSSEVVWMFFSAAICTTYLSGLIVNRTHHLNGVPLYRSIAPCLRVMFVLVIAGIAVARLNWNFVDVEFSPVAAALSQFRGNAAASPWIVYLTISILVVVDFSIAMALLVPSLRRFAVGFGTCYFAWQALIGFGEARLMLPLFIAALFLFTSTEFVGRIYERLHRWVPIPAVRVAGIPIATVCFGIVAGAVWWQARSATAETPLPISSAQIVGWSYFIFVAVWSALLLSSLVDERPRLTWVSLVLRNPVQYLLLLVLLVVVVSPFVGLGSVGRLVDNSGLSVEGGVSNHLVIPQAHLVDFDTDLVEVTYSNDPYLQSVSDAGRLMTWFEFVNYVSVRPKTEVSFVRGDGQFEVEKTGSIEELSKKNSWILRKLITYELSNRSTRASRVVAQP